jgi:hypothetical protein
MAQQACLGVFGRDKVAVDDHAPALVDAKAGLARHAIHEGRQLWPEQKDIDAEGRREEVQVVQDVAPERVGLGVGHERAINVHRVERLGAS